MTRLTLSLACWEYPRTKPILDGEVSPEGIELLTTKSHPADTFWRAFRIGDFDVTEMSLASMMISLSRGQRRWWAIPVFPCRSFFYTWILCKYDSGLKSPSDLKGKRFGLPEYQMTAAVWIRGIFKDEFNVKPEDIEWYQERTEHRIPVKIPERVKLYTLPVEKNIRDMLIDGELDAILYGGSGRLVDRSQQPLHKHRNFRWLFEDIAEEEVRFFRKTGIFPINHVIVVKKEILEKHPWVAMNIYMAFEKAKQLAYESDDKMFDFISAPNLVCYRGCFDKQLKIFGQDPYPYGFKTNRPVLEKLSEYLYQQGLTERKVEPEELFFENTLDS
ncbi:MAG: ABC transporter substrate-binding protein [Nitrososphaerota archaeon]